jgi:hypothetical protein
MDDDQNFYYCVKHHKVERGAGCRAADRLGPFKTEAEAAAALDTVQRRNQEWDSSD